jgi:type I restriction enzyme S subunit
MHSLSDRMQKQKWFRGIKQRFSPLEKVNKVDQYFAKYFNQKTPVFDNLIELLDNATESECEIVSTLYAVWNDLIIQKMPVNETEIITRFYQWSDRKKQYKEDQLKKALNWMNENRLIPKGFGPLIKHKKNKKN